MYYIEITVADSIEYAIMDGVIKDILEDCPYDAEHSWEQPSNPNDEHRITVCFHTKIHVSDFLELLQNAEEDGEIEFPFNTQTFNSHDEYANYKGWNDEPDDEDADAQWLENAYGPND